LNAEVYLTQAEIGGHQMACWRTGSQAMGMSALPGENLRQQLYDQTNTTQQFVVDNSEGRSASAGGVDSMSSGQQPSSGASDPDTENKDVYTISGETTDASTTKTEKTDVVSGEGDNDNDNSVAGMQDQDYAIIANDKELMATVIVRY